MDKKQIGIVGIIMSRKATMVLLILIVSSVGLFTHILPGLYFAAIIGTIGTSWLAAHSYQDTQQGGMNGK